MHIGIRYHVVVGLQMALAGQKVRGKMLHQQPSEGTWEGIEDDEEEESPEIVSEDHQAEIISLCGQDGFQLFQPRALRTHAKERHLQ